MQGMNHTIRVFLFTHYPKVYKNITRGLIGDEVRKQLIIHAERHAAVPELLQMIENERPETFQQFKLRLDRAARK